MKKIYENYETKISTFLKYDENHPCTENSRFKKLENFGKENQGLLSDLLQFEKD